MTDPGKMNRRVLFQSRSLTPDAGGGYTEAVVDLAETWAYVEPLEGDEQLRAMQTGMKRPHRFTVRYRENVGGATGLVYAGRAFDVRSVVDPDAGHMELVIMADEILP